MNEWVVRVAGVDVGLRSSGRVLEAMTPRYGPFLVEPESADPLLWIELEDEGPVEEAPGRLPSYTVAGDMLTMSNHFSFRLEADLAAGEGRASIREMPLDQWPGQPPVGPQGLLRCLVPYLAVTRLDGLVLHGCGIRHPERGSCVVFCGMSGAGKSTLAAFFEPEWVLSDELVIVTDVGAHATAHSTPFPGTMDRVFGPNQGPLAEVLSLEKGGEYKLGSMAEAAGFRHLLRCVAYPEGPAADEGLLLQRAAAIPKVRRSFSYDAVNASLPALKGWVVDILDSVEHT